MTWRARWMVLLALTSFVLGVYGNRHTLALFSLSVLVWVFFLWLWFHLRLWLELTGLQLQRTINGRETDRGILFAGRRVDVEVTVSNSRRTFRVFLVAEDFVPEDIRVEQGEVTGRLMSRAAELTLKWQGTVLAAGRIRFHGIRLTVTDTFGFFSVQKFLAQGQSFRVMPGYRQAGDLQPMVKRMNVIPSHGVHRLQRSGMGSELLELREYVPGDPPKSIAWKVSARRDTLMTRQYESEVPVRTTLFVDGSIANRMGGFGSRLLDQSMFVAASLARTAVSAGDPVSVVTFDERGSRRLQFQTGESGFFQILSQLSDFAQNPQPPLKKLNGEIINAVIRVAGMRHPELLDPKINRVPFSIFPLLPWRRRRLIRRTQAAAVLAQHFGFSPFQMVSLIYRDNSMTRMSLRFLNDMNFAWMSPLVTSRELGFHDGLSTIESLSSSLTRSVATAKDNEVFVLMANLLESSAALHRLVPAIKLAVSRHHRVAVVCPTPTFRRPDRNQEWPYTLNAEILLQHADKLRVAELSERLVRMLRRLNVAVSISGEESAISMIASETQMARSGRARAGR